MLTISCHTTEIAQDPPENGDQWVHLLPTGTFRGRDGRGPYRLDDPDALIRATLARAGGMDLVVDYDHQAEEAPSKRGPVPAAGWIKELAARPDGIYGRVEWTEAARAALKAREYRYISPVFIHSPDGRARVLLRAGLTNVPNLDLKAVASQQPSSMEIHQMNFLNKLVAALGLPEGATEDDVVTHCQKLGQKLADAPEKSSLHAQLAQSLGLEEAEEEELIVALNAALAAADPGKQPDPSKYVPMQVFKELQEQVAVMKQDQDIKAATAAVEAALAEGKLTPAMRDWGISLHRSDPKKFEDFVATAPVISAAAQDMATGASAVEGKGQLTAEEKAVCRQLGITEEDYLKTKEDEQ